MSLPVTPTQNPEALLYKLLFTANSEGDVVLDPFMGGGIAVNRYFKYVVGNNLERTF
jgi:DNA modification methylase